MTSDEMMPPSTNEAKMRLVASEKETLMLGKASGCTPPSGATDPGAFDTAMA